jgi:chemotaxis protein MotB
VDKVLFNSGSAEITPHGREILLKVGGVLGRVKGKSIYVVGHTDTMPIHSALYPSNWELSTARSSSVIRFLTETGGLTPERLTAMGRAFYQPVASNATPEGRHENRRVEIIVADVPILTGEAGSETMRGTVSGKSPDVPAGQKPNPQPQEQPLRETSPSPAEPTPDASKQPAESPSPGPQASEPTASESLPAASQPPSDAQTAPEPTTPGLPPSLPDRPVSGQ